MTTLHDIIQAAYPDAVPLTDYELRDDSDGRGPYLAAWHISGPIPAGVPMNSPTKRWIDHCLANILTPGAAIIDGLLTAGRLAPLAAQDIAATEPGAIVPGTMLTREQAEQLMALALHVMAFVETPMVEGSETPSQIISRYK